MGMRARAGLSQRGEFNSTRSAATGKASALSPQPDTAAAQRGMSEDEDHHGGHPFGRGPRRGACATFTRPFLTQRLRLGVDQPERDSEFRGEVALRRSAVALDRPEEPQQDFVLVGFESLFETRTLVSY
jgi:hypothetical protein